MLLSWIIAGVMQMTPAGEGLGWYRTNWEFATLRACENSRRMLPRQPWTVTFCGEDTGVGKWDVAPATMWFPKSGQTRHFTPHKMLPSRKTGAA